MQGDHKEKNHSVTAPHRLTVHCTPLHFGPLSALHDDGCARSKVRLIQSITWEEMPKREDRCDGEVTAFIGVVALHKVVDNLFMVFSFDHQKVCFVKKLRNKCDTFCSDELKKRP